MTAGAAEHPLKEGSVVRVTVPEGKSLPLEGGISLLGGDSTLGLVRSTVITDVLKDGRPSRKLTYDVHAFGLDASLTPGGDELQKELLRNLLLSTDQHLGQVPKSWVERAEVSNLTQRFEAALARRAGMDTFVAHLQPTVAEGQALLQRLLGPDSDGKGGNLTPLGQSAGGTKTLRDARERAAGKMPETRDEDDDDEDGVEVELLGLTSPLKRARPMSSASRGAETESDEFGAVKSGGARDTHLAALNPLHLAPRGALEVLHKYVPAALLPDLLVALSLEEDAPVSVRAVKTKLPKRTKTDMLGIFELCGKRGTSMQPRDGLEAADLLSAIDDEFEDLGEWLSLPRAASLFQVVILAFRELVGNVSRYPDAVVKVLGGSAAEEIAKASFKQLRAAYKRKVRTMLNASDDLTVKDRAAQHAPDTSFLILYMEEVAQWGIDLEKGCATAFKDAVKDARGEAKLLQALHPTSHVQEDRDGDGNGSQSNKTSGAGRRRNAKERNRRLQLGQDANAAQAAQAAAAVAAVNDAHAAAAASAANAKTGREDKRTPRSGKMPDKEKKTKE